MGVIPLPLSMEPNSGHFRLPQDFCVGGCGEGTDKICKIFVETLRDRYGISCSFENIPCGSTQGYPVTLRMEDSVASLDDLRNKEEGYELNVTEDEGVVIVGLMPNGLFYGVQTLLQLIPLNQSNGESKDVVLDCVKIVDAPRFKWRGTLLDVGRHFFGVKFVKRFLDVLALHKINRFHWHLVEDQGWRLEIKSLPKLTDIGAWRTKEGEQAYGGYYKHEEVHDIVAYARDRFIEVVPEIELPGHCGSALASYPTLSCRGDIVETPTDWGIHKDVYCAGKDEVFKFLETVLGEVVEMFPYEYIHIGGDECPKMRWKECSNCQECIKKHNLEGENELQSWFISQISRFLHKNGRKIIGWDEVLEGGIPYKATVMSWRGMLGGLLAAKLGHDVIMSPTNHCYLDYRQAVRNDEPGAWFGVLPLELVYAFEPVPSPPPFSVKQNASSDGGDSPPDQSPSSEQHPAPSTPDCDTEMEKEEEINSSSMSSHDCDARSPDAVGSAEKDKEDGGGDRMDWDKEGSVNGASGEGSGLKALTEEEEKRILGGQANLWTEYVEDEDTAEYMLLPRLSAFCETVWSPKDLRDWDGFHARLESHIRHFDAIGVKYRPLN